MYKPYWVFYLFIIALATNFFSCNDDFENYSNNPQDLLAFSKDTVSFDTVLTTVTSPYKAFYVYNKNAKPLLIKSIRLSEGIESNFKINVDGAAGTIFENIEVLAKDSILILVDIKPKEGRKELQALLTDYVVFETNNVQQKVVLEAFVQDVFAWRGVILSSDSILDNKKPYLIYDSLVIDNGITVEIREGSIFYMHNDAQLIVRGTIKVKGSVDNPVVFRGSRTDKMVSIPYDLIPGQWGGIRFEAESYENEFENVRIRNGKYGMNLLVCDDPYRNKLYMKNVVLTNVTGFLLLSVNCNIIAENCEFSNAKDQILVLVGGSYQFTHCTIVNYYPTHTELGWANSDNCTLWLYNSMRIEVLQETFYYPVIKADFINSIIWGGKRNKTSPDSNSSEISIGTIDSTISIPFFFKNCLLLIDETDDPRVVDCLFQVDPIFQKCNSRDEEKNRFHPYFDFRLKKDSPAKDKADIEIASKIPYDLNGNSRLSDGFPDIGAYEYNN